MKARSGRLRLIELSARPGLIRLRRFDDVSGVSRGEGGAHDIPGGFELPRLELEARPRPRKHRMITSAAVTLAMVATAVLPVESTPPVISRCASETAIY